MIIRSPVDGIVNNLKYHTIGGVISHGQPIMEISPTNDPLIIEAKVSQKNIDSVHEGLVAKIRFSAFKSRTTPTFTGKVVSISQISYKMKDSIRDNSKIIIMLQELKSI